MIILVTEMVENWLNKIQSIGAVRPDKRISVQEAFLPKRTTRFIFLKK